MFDLNMYSISKFKRKLKPAVLLLNIHMYVYKLTKHYLVKLLVLEFHLYTLIYSYQQPFKD